MTNVVIIGRTIEHRAHHPKWATANVLYCTALPPSRCHVDQWSMGCSLLLLLLLLQYKNGYRMMKWHKSFRITSRFYLYTHSIVVGCNNNKRSSSTARRINRLGKNNNKNELYTRQPFFSLVLKASSSAPSKRHKSWGDSLSLKRNISMPVLVEAMERPYVNRRDPELNEKKKSFDLDALQRKDTISFFFPFYSIF